MCWLNWNVNCSKWDVYNFYWELDEGIFGYTIYWLFHQLISQANSFEVPNIQSNSQPTVSIVSVTTRSNDDEIFRKIWHFDWLPTKAHEWQPSRTTIIIINRYADLSQPNEREKNLLNSTFNVLQLTKIV